MLQRHWELGISEYNYPAGKIPHIRIQGKPVEKKLPNEC
jgi:hypothetical protein